MTSNEKRLLISGVGIGVLVAVLAGGAITVINHRSRAAHEMQAGAAESQSSAAEESSNSSRGDGAMADTGTAPGTSVELTEQEQQAAGVQISELRRQHLTTEVSAFGRVEEPESQLSTISARVAGRLDKLELQYTGQNVRRGQAIAQIYSPELAASAQEYRLAKESRTQLSSKAQPEAIQAADDLIQASRRRLELWGVTPAQIEQMASGESKLDVAIYSPTSGTVVERKVTQGQYVNSGDVLYTVADLSTVWVKADVYEADLPQIQAGQPVEITSDALPNQTIHGRVEFIEPQATAETRTIPVHVHVSNTGMRLRPGMFVRAVFGVHRADTLTIPRSAVLDTGTRKLVYVAKAGGVFEAREVQLGQPNRDLYPILSGLKDGEHVVTNGNFLIDSQTRLSGGMTGLFGGSKEFGSHDHANGGGVEAKPTAETRETRSKLTYRIEPDPPKGAAPAEFHVKLADSAAKPISDAQVNVTLVMPAMPAMSMPEMRATGTLTWNGSEYAGKVDVPMAGSWNTTIEAKRAGQVVASQRVRLQAR